MCRKYYKLQFFSHLYDEKHILKCLSKFILFDSQKENCDKQFGMREYVSIYTKLRFCKSVYV